MQRLRIVLLFLFLGLVACETAVIGTPTPFPTEAAVTPLPGANRQPISLEIADLLATPAASQNALIRLTGQYFRRPKLICENDPRPSPATWELAAGEAIALAGGFDRELRRLLPDGLTMTVEGYWLLWRGPVGCGKRAKVQDIWYLHVNRIVSPSPITQVTLTPFIPGVEVAALGTPQMTLTPGAPITATVVTPTVPAGQLPSPTPLQAPPPPLTPTVGPVFPTNTPQVDVTDVFTPTNTPEGEESTPIVEPTATVEDKENGTVTPTATLDPSVPTNTPAPSATPDPNMTATFTPTPSSGSQITIQEEIEAMSLSKNILGVNEIHAWPFVIDAAEVITVTAVTIDNVDLVLSIVDEAGTTLIEENAGAGEVVIIGQFDLLPPALYQIHVKAEDGIPAEYALMLLFSDSLNFVFQPIIEYGVSESVNLPASSEHFWHFAGSAGDQITITAIPNSTTDVFLELYGPDADRISDPFISVGTDGVTEELDFTLPEDGLYSIRVGEWDFAAGSYQLRLAEN